MLGVIDYGMGNLYSVTKALERLDAPCFVSGDVDELKQADGLILPGVGSFKDAMELLHQYHLVPFLQQATTENKPLLGICLGMQLLFSMSEENGENPGLGLLSGDVIRFSGVGESGVGYKVPHMGWNRLCFRKPDHPLLQGLAGDYAYFAHSYFVRANVSEDVVATSDYDGEVPAVVGHGSVFGTQFHPEKSSRLGMGLLANYCRLVESGGNHESVYNFSSD